MNQQIDQLAHYIDQQLKAGHSEEQIREVLRQHNWEEGQINEAFQQLSHRAMEESLQSQPLAEDGEVPEPVIGGAATDAPAGHPFGTPAGSAGPNQDPYPVAQATRDTIAAIKTNLKTYLLSIFVGYFLIYGSVMLIAAVAAVAIVAQMFSVGGSLSPQTILINIVIFVPLLLVALAVLQTVVFIASALPVYTGSKGEKSTLREVFSTAFSRALRVIGANLLYSLIIAGPLIVIFLASALAGFAADGSPVLPILGFILALVAFIWAVIAAFRYLLAPYVALFEPDVPLTQTLAQSRQLMQGNSAWFVLKGFLLLLLLTIALSLLTTVAQQEQGVISEVIGNLFLGSVNLLATGVMVLFYRNRKAVRGTPSTAPGDAPSQAPPQS